MKPEEAISILKGDLHIDVPKAAVTARNHDIAINMAIEALKKRIQMKPKTNTVDWFQCPCCGDRFSNNQPYKSTLYKNCPRCGQAILQGE